MALLSPHSSGLSPHTKTLTADLRWSPLAELRVGDELIALDEEKGSLRDQNKNAFRRWRLASVLSIERVFLPSMRIAMDDGTTFLCSTRYSWLAPASGASVWSESRFLKQAGEYPGASRVTRVTGVWQEDRSWEAGYLAAAVDGEGHLSQFDNAGRRDSIQFRLGFAQRQNAMLAEFKIAAAKLGFVFSFSGSLNYSLRGGKAKTMAFLGTVRPRRLLASFQPARIGTVHRMANVRVKTVECADEQELVAIRTSTGTLLLEGFAGHDNSRSSNACTRESRIVSYCGQEMHLSDAIALSGIGENTVRLRLHYGWPIERALTEPPRRRRPSAGG